MTASRADAPRPVSPARPGRLAYALGLAPLFLLAVVSLAAFVEGFNTGSLGFDFRGAYLPAADAVRAGDSPYPPVEGPELASHNAYVYPPLLAYVLVPFTILPETVASVIAVLVAGSLLAGTLAVLGVRDLRCYGAMLLWAPTVNALHMASSSVLLAFAAAVAWRFRASTWPLAASVGLGVATKLIVWPLLVWTFACGRLRAAALALVVGGGVTLAGWAALAFDGLERYPALLRRLAALEAEESYSLVGAAASLGVGDVGARVVAVGVGVVLLFGCVALARRGEEFRSFALALAAALAFSPIVWLHYFVLLLVPLAIARPRFSVVWTLPFLLWLTPLNGNGESIQPLLPLLVAATIFAFVLSHSQRDPARQPAVAR